MGYSGSGNFVAVSASNNGHDDIYSPGVHGVTFGWGDKVYCSFSPHYKLQSDGDTIAGASLSIEAGSNGRRLCVEFPALRRLDIRGSETYSGSVRVASDVTVNTSTWIPTTVYKTYTFYCGMLTNV